LDRSGGRGRRLSALAQLRLFASVREAAGIKQVNIDAPTVAAVISAAETLFGPDFAAQVPSCRVWLNGDPAVGSEAVTATDEVALLPPVSGG
jgi:molybdopterin converting factor small subunit